MSCAPFVFQTPRFAAGPLFTLESLPGDFTPRCLNFKVLIYILLITFLKKLSDFHNLLLILMSCSFQSYSFILCLDKADKEKENKYNHI